VLIDPTQRPRTGHDLAVLRVWHGIRQAEVAAALGLSRQRVGQWEAAQRPSARAIARYVDALEDLARE
jgi:transcriptional regulator with XRE-family HTH domain